MFLEKDRVFDEREPGGWEAKRLERGPRGMLVLVGSVAGRGGRQAIETGVVETLEENVSGQHQAASFRGRWAGCSYAGCHVIQRYLASHVFFSCLASLAQGNAGAFRSPHQERIWGKDENRSLLKRLPGRRHGEAESEDGAAAAHLAAV